MGRTKKPWTTSVVLCLSAAALIFACGPAGASPTTDAATGRFQAAVQQQNMFSILTSIEERLRNLDNIYTMQLSQTLETKLDQYSRRLEALDNKIIRLEALVMLNLDKISENISTKNFKDDMGRTNLLRKMESVYEGISHRLGYMERKYETNMAKIQTKVDSTSTRMEKIEEHMTSRDSEMEEEISDVIFAIDNLKTTCTSIESKLYNNISTTLNATIKSYKFMQDMNVDTRKSMHLLHDNIIETLKYMNNRNVKVVEDNNFILKAMRTELKEDFNDYANKVADMNSNVWKSSATIEDNLERLETVANSTKIELQNGVRSLMVQIGKVTNKENVISTGDNTLEELDKKLNSNFQRILTNQDLFLESCHRLQMDESQIESEISDMLGKLINMLEKKLGSEMKDIKNLEKSVKAHDARLMRNVHQVNSNVMSLFKKSISNNEVLTREIGKVGGDLNALFAFVQSTITGSSFSFNLKELQEKLNKLENLILALSASQRQPSFANLQSVNNRSHTEDISDHLERFYKKILAIDSRINNTLNEWNSDKIFTAVFKKHFNNCLGQNHTKPNSREIAIDEDTRRVIENIFGKNPALEKSYPVNKTKCSPNYKNLLDIRSKFSHDCDSTQENSKKKKERHRASLIDVRGNFELEDNSEYEESEENLESSTVDNLPDEIIEEISTEISETNNYDIFS